MGVFKDFPVAVSLGCDCRVRYQISRHIHEHTPVEQRSESLSKALSATAGSPATEGAFFFDWLITPYEGLVLTLANRFENVFERQNLAIHKNGSVYDTRNGLIFHHDFSKTGGRVTEEILAQEYDRIREKRRYLATKTLAMMTNTDNVLYIIAVVSSEQLAKLAQLLSQISGRKSHVIGVRGGDTTQGFVEKHDDRSLYVMARKVNKPAVAGWQGDDDEWRAMFAALGS